MKNILCLLTLLVTSFTYADTKLGLMGSVLYNVPKNEALEDLSNSDDDSEVGYGIGMRALMGLNDQFFFRSGAGLVMKEFGADYNQPLLQGTVSNRLLYLNIPLTLYVKASPMVGFFFGSAIQAKLSDNCEGTKDFKNCKVQDDETLVFPAILGFDFSFHESFSMELSYEYGIMESVKDTKVSSAVLSFIYNFPTN